MYPVHIPATKTEPIDLQLSDVGPSHSDIARLDDPLGVSGGESGGAPLILADRYQLLRPLGRGGMGTVYLAEQLDGERIGERIGANSPESRRKVAIKVLDASAHDWCRTIDRFLWEARLCSRIQHPNIVEAFEYGSTPSGVVFMVMELLEGRDLRVLIREHGRLSWRWTRYVMRQVCAGTDALHRAGVVHRDLKPSNCFYVRRNGAIKLLDLGIATFEDPRTGPSSSGSRRIDLSSSGSRRNDLSSSGSRRIDLSSSGSRRNGPLTENDGTVVGTPEYMSPEQIRGAPVDRRADVYSAGIMTYELLTGRLPFQGRTTEEVFDRQISYPPPPLDRFAPEIVVPAGLDDVLRKALAKRPAARFASMSEFADALAQFE